MPVSIEAITALFGWCVVINSSVLCLFTIALVVGRDWIPKFHGKLFSLPANELKAEYFRFLANYKLIVLTFNIVPYIALKFIQ